MQQVQPEKEKGNVGPKIKTGDSRAPTVVQQDRQWSHSLGLGLDRVSDLIPGWGAPCALGRQTSPLPALETGLCKVLWRISTGGALLILTLLAKHL